MLEALLFQLETSPAAAWSDARWVTGPDLRLRAQSVARAILSADSAPRRTLLAFDRDRAAFAAALLGSWIAGRPATLLTDARRDHARAAAAGVPTEMLLHDCGIGRGLFVPGLLARELEDGDAIAYADFRASDPMLVALGARDCPVTFGLSDLTRRQESPASDASQPGWAAHAWTAHDLERELARLVGELDWSARGPVVTTLTPASVPGALLGVLLPISSGVPFSTEVPREPSAVARCVQSIGARVLVSTPAHLRALLELPPGALRGLDFAVSAWGTLPDELARDFERRHAVELRACMVPPSALVAPSEVEAQRDALRALDGVSDAEVIRAGDGLFAVVRATAIDERDLLDTLRARVAGPLPKLRRVERIPRDANGHTWPDDVLRCFGLDPSGRPARLELEWSAGGEADCISVRIPESSAWFDGHFPGHPILAGAVQLQELVLPTLRRAHRIPFTITAWSSLKFLAPIRPGDHLHLQLRIDVTRGVADFTLRRGSETCSSGRVEFRSETDAEAARVESAS